MRRVSTATCTSGDPVSPSCVRFSRMISAFCSATANFSFLLFVFIYIVSPIQLLMLPHAIDSIGGCTRVELAPRTARAYDSPPSGSGGCGAEAGRLSLRLNQKAPRASRGMNHHPNTRVESIAAARACNTASEAVQAFATTRAGAQAGGGFGGGG